jgi:hypothetical protein
MDAWRGTDGALAHRRVRRGTVGVESHHPTLQEGIRSLDRIRVANQALKCHYNAFISGGINGST